jgi:hypothetical protein
MTEEKGTIAKRFRYILPVILIFAIVFAVIGYRQGGVGAERQSRAALMKLFSCTLQQAEDFDAAAEPDRVVLESETDGETGLIQDNQKLLENYFMEQFHDVMTDTCIEELVRNRTFYRSIALAKQFNSDMEAGEIELVQRAGEQECYTFSAEIKTIEGDLAAAVTGIISMEKDEGRWKASHITLTNITYTD